MDRIDREILSVLRLDGKISHKELANKIGLSLTPTYERVRKLEKQGVIQGYRADISPSDLGLNLTVFIQISLEKHQHSLIASFKKKVLDLVEVVSCSHVSGGYDFLIKVMVEDMNSYQRFVVDKLSAIPGISNVQSSFVMEEVKADYGPKINR